MKSSSKKSQKIVMVSGGFDPVHPGHIRLFKDAKKLGDRLVVVINNDHWINLKKGMGFMSAEDRAEIISAFHYVDDVIISKHQENTTDTSICEEIRELRPHIFANGGDRFADNIPEFQVCRELDIEMVFNVGHGGKIGSSSDLLKEHHKKHQKYKKKNK